MASEDSDQLRPGFVPIHRLGDLRDRHETLSGQVFARGDLLHAQRELLEVALLGRPQRVLPEKRDDRLEQIVTPANDVLRQVFFVVVVPAILVQPAYPKEILQILETRTTLYALRDNKPVEHLIAGFVAAPSPSASLTDEADREASFSVYKTNNPANPDQPFLLIVRTARIVTPHDRKSRASTGQILGFSSI